jgi:hypothetical protein
MVSYWVDDLGNAVINGDEVYGTEEEILAAAVGYDEGDDDIIRRSISLTPVDSRRWPEGKVYYKFDPAITSAARNLFLDGAKAWKDRLPFLQFIEADTPDSRTIRSIPGGWSWSPIGCCGGDLSLGQWADLRTAIHEIGHSEYFVLYFPIAPACECHGIPFHSIFYPTKVSIYSDTNRRCFLNSFGLAP